MAVVTCVSLLFLPLQQPPKRMETYRSRNHHRLLPFWKIIMSPKVSCNGAKEAGKAKAVRTGDKKRKRRRKESYSIYIYKVLKQVHPDTGISSTNMSIERHICKSQPSRSLPQVKHHHFSWDPDRCQVFSSPLTQCLREPRLSPSTRPSNTLFLFWDHHLSSSFN